MGERGRRKSDFRTPIIGPIREGQAPPVCEDAPEGARILRAMPPVGEPARQALRAGFGSRVPL